MPATRSRVAGVTRREETERAVDVQPGAVLLGKVCHGCERIEAARRSPRRRSPTRIAGEPSSSRSARPSAPHVERPGRVAAKVRICRRPMPSIASALTALAWTWPLASTGTGGSAERPSSSTSTPCCSPHQRRAAARPVKFAIVAPVVSTPLHAAGRPNSSFSQSTRDLLEAHRERRADPVERDLVDRARQPVRGERRRRPAAHDEVEEPRAGRARGRDVGGVDQRAKRRERARTVLGQRAAEASTAVRLPGGRTRAASTPAR